MIVVTGAGGFIASNLLEALYRLSYFDLVGVDDFDREDKKHKVDHLKNIQYVHRDSFLTWLDQNQKRVQFIFHLGARTDTTEKSQEVLDRLNLTYSQNVFKACVLYGIPLVYASSAATYGDGALGYKDDHQTIESLRPLNLYGHSKHDFDLWVLKQEKKPFFWTGLKFFNVYGPGENHKGKMASVVYHAFHQIKRSGKMKLFKSHRADIQDGAQSRDFIYVDDLVKVCLFFMIHRKNSGIYNLGTGLARSFKDLTLAVFKSMNLDPDIDYIDTPAELRKQYQYYTQAEMAKLRQAGYADPFLSLEEGVKKYVAHLTSAQ